MLEGRESPGEAEISAVRDASCAATGVTGNRKDGT
jgi:hypothetical protein